MREELKERDADENDGGIAFMDAEATDAELAAMAPQRFTVKDESSADWLVRKLVEADAHIRRVKEQVDREMRRTERERDFLLMRFGPDLERWTKKQLEQHKGRRKSVLLLSGTVGFRQLASKVVVEDDVAVLRWAKKHCRGAVQVVERISKNALDTHVESTGELPNGVRVEPAREKFYVK